jgi:hypothetical protein
MATASLQVVDLTRVPVVKKAWVHSSQLPDYQLHTQNTVVKSLARRSRRLCMEVDNTVPPTHLPAQWEREKRKLAKLTIPRTDTSAVERMTVNVDDFKKLHCVFVQ